MNKKFVVMQKEHKYFGKCNDFTISPKVLLQYIDKGMSLAAQIIEIKEVNASCT